MNFLIWLRATADRWKARRRLKELRSAVEAHLNVLPISSAQLRDTSHQVEQAVAQVGGNFARMVEHAMAGTNQASALVGTGATSDDGASTGVRQLLSTSQATLEDLLIRIVRDSEVCSRVVERMETLEREMGRIMQALEDVDRISFSNTILALNAKIEAAHIGDRGQGFELVAQELWMQSQQSEQITSEIRNTILRLANAAKAAGGELSEMACADHARIASLQAQVHEALGRLTSAHEETEQALSDGEARNKALAGEISAAVQAMQFQDRVSQQIAHIVEALDGMQQAIVTPLDASGTQEGRPVGAQLLSNNYTMERERTVHAAVLGNEEVSQQPLDDVELF